MTTTRRRRIVKRIVLVPAGAGLLAAGWLMLRAPPEVDRSRAVKLGMSFDEVEAVMGIPQKEIRGGNYNHFRVTLCYGAALATKERIYREVSDWTSGRISPWRPSMDDYPVHVRFDLDRPLGLVDRIERGDEVEE